MDTMSPKPNQQQQAILDLVEAPSRDALVDWIETNALDFAKYTRSDCHLSHAGARAVAATSLELLVISYSLAAPI
jgi:hypothetical protein